MAGDERAPRVLYLEPWEGGSHARLGEALATRWQLERLTLPARHWKWRMRGAAVWFAEQLVTPREVDLLFASSYLALAELVGLCPWLSGVPRVLYFHENQLVYPVQRAPPRDHHFGFTQLVSALAADRVVFNSAWNRDSFLEAGEALLKRMPDAVPRDWIPRLASRSEVVPVPVDLDWTAPRGPIDRAAGPLILWNHRWEHDKGPERFFGALEELAARGLPFRVAVCGRRYDRAPEVFDRARAHLGERIVHWGWLPDADAYRAWLGRADIAVSTADHEFQGISLIEATHAGAVPLVPDRLVYPEIYDAAYRYGADAGALVQALAGLCRRWSAGEELARPGAAGVARFARDAVLPRYDALIPRFDAKITGA